MILIRFRLIFSHISLLSCIALVPFLFSSDSFFLFFPLLFVLETLASLLCMDVAISLPRSFACSAIGRRRKLSAVWDAASTRPRQPTVNLPLLLLHLLRLLFIVVVLILLFLFLSSSLLLLFLCLFFLLAAAQAHSPPSHPLL